MNPSNWVGDPEMAPGTGFGMGGWLLLVVATYAVVFWLVFKGPLRAWADQHTGGAYMLLIFGPMAVFFVLIALG